MKQHYLEKFFVIFSKHLNKANLSCHVGSLANGTVGDRQKQKLSPPKKITATRRQRRRLARKDVAAGLAKKFLIEHVVGRSGRLVCFLVCSTEDMICYPP